MPHCFYIQSISVSPSGESIAVGGDGSYCCGGEVARVWDTATGRERYRIMHRFDVTHVAFSPDEEYLVTASWYGTAKIIDRSGHVIRVLQEDGGFSLVDARFSSDGLLVATAAIYGLGELGRAESGSGTGRAVRSSARSGRRAPPGLRSQWSPDRDGRSGGFRGDMGCDERNARIRARGADGGLTDVAFSPDGSRVATASYDGTVRLFEARTGEQQLVLRGSGCAVYGVNFSPDGTKLASTSWCDGVRIWALDIDDLLEIARQEVNRQLSDEECRQYLHVDRCRQA
jgi:WD40 repeat protein